MDADARRVLTGAHASKALATSGPHGINVVPVSAIRVTDEYVFLFNFFMRKTAQNVQSRSEVSLVAWQGSEGYQVKASCEYFTDGAVFADAQEWVSEHHPTRELRAVLRLSPTQVFDISLP